MFGPATPNQSHGGAHLLSAKSLPGTKLNPAGCHFFHVRAWDRLRKQAPDSTYGPLCWDSTPPKTTAYANGSTAFQSVYTAPVTVVLAATNPGSSNGTGSGVFETDYAINCACLPTDYYHDALHFDTGGTYTLKFRSYDSAGNFEAIQSRTFTVDLG